MQNKEHPIDEYDREFISLIMDIEKRCETFNKHNRLRVESWCKKLCQVTNNIEWKKNRNLHAICLLDMMLNNRFEDPYNKFAPEGSLAILSKTIVKSRLSQKFWKNSEKVYGNNNQTKDKQEIPINEDNDINFNNEALSKSKSLSIPNTQSPKVKSINNTMNINLTNNSNELDQMRELIEKLKYDLENKDRVIQNQNNEKTRLTKRVNELEKMLASFLVSDIISNNYIGN